MHWLNIMTKWYKYYVKKNADLKGFDYGKLFYSNINFRLSGVRKSVKLEVHYQRQSDYYYFYLSEISFKKICIYIYWKWIYYKYAICCTKNKVANVLIKLVLFFVKNFMIISFLLLLNISLNKVKIKSFYLALKPDGI